MLYFPSCSIISGGKTLEANARLKKMSWNNIYKIKNKIKILDHKLDDNSC